MRLVSWQRLSTQVVIMQVAILVVTMVAGFAIFQWNLKRQLYGQYEQRSLMLAETLASQPSIIGAVVHGLPGGEAQRLATAARHRTGALFVVITNARGIRYSHPHPWMIGLPVQDDPEPPASESFRTGKPWTGIQEGTLGLVAAGKTPLWDGRKLVGEVSVGFWAGKVSRQLASTLPSLAIYLLGVLAVGVLAALGLARRLKRQTFGLELGEIAGLLQEREAMLHGIREAVLGYDRGERVILANDAARQLLRLFEVIAEVHTAAAAVDAIMELRPELLLLDLYLPDEHGLDLVARLRGSSYPPVDVIVITAAKDADSVRAAMQHGALHYRLKPFSFPALRDKLLSYAQMRSRLDGLRAADQRSVDRVYGALRAPGQVAASKGRSDYTLETVEELLARADGDLSAAEIAERAGMSRATAQRYLTHLHDLGRVEIRMRYGVSGRPEHGYRRSPAR